MPTPDGFETLTTKAPSVPFYDGAIAVNEAYRMFSPAQHDYWRALFAAAKLKRVDATSWITSGPDPSAIVNVVAYQFGDESGAARFFNSGSDEPLEPEATEESIDDVPSNRLMTVHYSNSHEGTAGTVAEYGATAIVMSGADAFTATAFSQDRELARSTARDVAVAEYQHLHEH